MAEYKEWIENAEVKIDYFSTFLKAWIHKTYKTALKVRYYETF